MTIHRSLALRRCALLLAALLLLAGCGASSSGTGPAEETPPAPVDDSSYVLQPQPDAALVEGSGMPIALALDAAGAEDGARNAAVLRGVQTFADTYHFTVETYTAADATPDAALAALTEASQSGAGLVVCAGETMAVALHDLQAEYPTVGYLLMDAEPHAADYSDYTVTANVHSVLFREEDAAYLAGYAAVMDGYTKLGFLGSSSMPDIVRYCTGFLQGAEAAAALTGQPVTVKTWYSGIHQPGDDLTARMSGWYTDGTELIFAAGGNLDQSCIAATRTAGSGRVIAAGWDHGAAGAEVLTTAANRYSAVVQQELYTYFGGGFAWGDDTAGQTSRLGAQQEAVALPTTDWRFATFDAASYAALYQTLRSGSVTVETYADSDSFPPTVNVTVESQN